MRYFVFPVAAAIVVACGSFGAEDDPSTKNANGPADIDAGGSSSSSSSGAISPDAGEDPNTVPADGGDDSGSGPGVETSPCAGASIFCEDFNDENALANGRLMKNDPTATTTTIEPNLGHDGTGIMRIVLSASKDQGEIYFALPASGSSGPQKTRYEMVFRTNATNSFDVGGVSSLDFAAGVTLTMNDNAGGLSLWAYKGNVGEQRGMLGTIPMDNVKWSRAVVDVDPANTTASFVASVNGGPPVASGTVADNFAAKLFYYFGPYRNNGVTGSATVEVDWVRVTAR